MSAASGPDGSSARLVDPIESGAAAVDRAFLVAGHGLGAGIATFEELSRGLGAFVAEFQDGRMAAASAALDRLAKRLVGLGGTLPRDAALLNDIACGNEGISKHLEALLEHIRMMGIIASTARIEAAVFTDAAGLDGFTGDMNTLTGTVKATVSRCAGQHAAMTERIRRLLAAQTRLDHDFRDRILVLAQELAAIFDQIAKRQRRGCELAQELSGRSSRLAGAVGTALVALQSGDATRQRMEHVAAALRLADDIGAGGAPEADVPPEGRVPAVAALQRLQAVQMDDLVRHFQAEAEDIDGVFRRLGEDARDLVATGQALVGADVVGGESFLSGFRTRLRDAAALVDTCLRSRDEVTDAMVALRADVVSLRRTITDLGATTLDLIMVGINAGLRAARLGLDGRSLMVIADELKRLAGVITAGSAELATAYEALGEASRNFDRHDAALTREEIGSGIVSIAAAFEASDRQMTAFVAAFEGRTQAFLAELGGLAIPFQEAVRTVTALGSEMGHETADAEAVPAPAPAVALRLTDLLWPRYTMERERELHRAALGGPAETVDAAESCDDDLFTLDVA